MSRVISFEGGIGAGKTSLANYFAYELKLPKILESYQENPFLADFYAAANVVLETEISFLLIHYEQLKQAEAEYGDGLVLADFSIEKDLVYAELNLNQEDLQVFRGVYDYVVEKTGIPHTVVYADLSPRMTKRRIFQRGREYEMSKDLSYFESYNDKVKDFFLNRSKSNVHCFDVDDLDLDEENEKLQQVAAVIKRLMQAG